MSVGRSICIVTLMFVALGAAWALPRFVAEDSSDIAGLRDDNRKLHADLHQRDRTIERLKNKIGALQEQNLNSATELNDALKKLAAVGPQPLTPQQREEEAQKLAETLRGAVKEQDTGSVLKTYENLLALGEPGFPPMVDLLVQMETDPDALGWLSGDGNPFLHAKESLDLMRQENFLQFQMHLLRNSRLSVRFRAAQVRNIPLVAGADTTGLLLEALHTSSEDVITQSLIRLLGIIKAEQAVPVFESLLVDPSTSYEVTGTIIEALGQIANVSAAALLERQTRNANPDLSGAAKRALARVQKNLDQAPKPSE